MTNNQHDFEFTSESVSEGVTPDKVGRSNFRYSIRPF